MSLYDNEFLGGADRYDDDDFFDDDFADRDEPDDGEDDDFFGGARKKARASASPKKSADASSKHSFSVAHVDVGSYEGGHFVSSTATNAAKKAATAIFRHIDLQSGAAKPGKNAKGETKSVKVDAGLKAKYGKKPITGVAVHFVLFRNERKSLSKYYAYVAKRTKLSSAAKGPVDKTGKQVKYEYKVELKKADLPAKYQALNEELKKEHNAKKAKKVAAEKKATNPKPKKTTSPKAKKTGTAKKTGAPKKATKVTLDNIIKALSSPAPKPKKAAAKKATSPKPKKAAAPKKATSPKPKKAAAPKKTSPKRAASPKPKKSPAKKAMKGGSGFCSFF